MLLRTTSRATARARAVVFDPEAKRQGADHGCQEAGELKQPLNASAITGRSYINDHAIARRIKQAHPADRDDRHRPEPKQVVTGVE